MELVPLIDDPHGDRWAKEFMELFGDKKEEIDEGLMLTWFANAIETGKRNA